MASCYFDTALGETVCDEPVVSVETAQSFGAVFLWLVVFAIALALIILIARYCYGVATRTGRSRIGFVWLSILLPAVALVICLVLDKDDERYSDEERSKYRLKK